MKLGIIRDRHFGEIIRGSGIAFLLKVFGTVLSFALSLLLARTLGAEGSGTYFLAFSVVTLLATFSRLGMDGTLVRFSAVCWQNRDFHSISFLTRTAFWLSLSVASATAMVFYLLVPLIAEWVFKKPELAPVLGAMSIGLVFYAWIIIMVSLLKGARRIRDSQILEVVLVPALTIIGVWLLADRAGARGAGIAFVVASIVTAAAGLLLTSNLWRPTPAASPYVTRSELIRASLPLLGVTTVNMLTVTLAPMFLGRFGSLADVAVFTMASKAAFITAILLASVSSISSPKFAEMYARNDRDQLERSVRDVNKLLTLIAVPILLGYLIFATKIMSLFGPEFVNGATVLMILSVGQFVGLSSGTVGQLLIATGFEKDCLKIMIVISMANIVLNFTLIPLFGIYGAAIATASTMIGKNLYTIVMAKRLLGISVSYLLPLKQAKTKSHEARPVA